MLLSRLPSGEPEIFATVQGEGVSTGVPSVFVRLAHCNLRCAWCDTAYTWDWERFDRKAHVLEVSDADVVARVQALSGARTRNVVITGGEPLLQQVHLVPVAERLRDAGYTIEVETNGTVRPSDAFAPLVRQWNVSPKLAGSGNDEAARLAPSVLAWFAARDDAVFKLVVADDAEVTEAVAIVARLGLDPARVILMPEGVDGAVISARSRWLADRCVEHGYRLGTRLHLYVWGAERAR